MEQLIKQIAALDAQRQILLGKPEPFGDHAKQSQVRELDARIAALFAQKRAMQVARYKADC